MFMLNISYYIVLKKIDHNENEKLILTYNNVNNYRHLGQICLHTHDLFELFEA